MKKPDAIKSIPSHKIIKEVWQFLGLTIETILTTVQTLPTHWLNSWERTNVMCSDKHHNAFTELKKCLQKPPILIYSDPNKLFGLFTDAPKYCWGAIPCQCTSKDNWLDYFTPITFISGQFLEHYTTLVRDALTIYMSLKRLCFYLQDAICNILCDYKSLEKFPKGTRKTVGFEVSSNIYIYIYIYIYELCIWQPYLFFLIYSHIWIPCLADIFLFPYLCQ